MRNKLYKFSIFNFQFSIFLLLTTYCLLPTALFAGITGKIAGKVIDTGTREPLPFVNVIIEGTTMGAATDKLGDFFIVNVPVGIYTVKATMIGYKAVKVKNVKVSTDMTTTVNFRLEPTVIKGEEVIVTAKRPIIERDVTSSSKRTSGKEISKMPVTNYEDVVALQAGSVETGRGSSGGLHIRGGRSDEVVYIVDGINTTDPVYGTSGAILDNNAISEMLIISGGFDAEYGRAMSGVVNVVTREGGTKYSGGIKYTTDNIFKKSSNLYKQGKLFNQGYNFGVNDGSITLGGPIPYLKRSSFFLSGGLRGYDSYLPHSDGIEGKGTLKLAWRLSNAFKATLSSNYAYRRYHGYWHSYSRGKWIDELPLYQRGNSQINLKLTHSVSSKTFYTLNIGRFNTYHKYSSQDGKDYNDFKEIGTRLSWVAVARDSGWYNPEYGTWEEGWSEDRAWMWYYENVRHLGQWNSSTGEWEWGDETDFNEIVDALNYRYYQTGTYLKGGSVPGGDKLVYTGVEDGETLYIYYHTFSLDKYINDVRKYINTDFPEDSIEPSGGLYMTRYNRDEFGRFCYYFYPMWHDRNTTRLSASFHLISQVNKYNEIKAGADIEKHDLDLTYLQFVNKNPYMDHYDKKPLTASAYLSDKIEYEDMVLKAGLRYDYFNPKSDFYINLDSLSAGQAEAEAKIQFSPRFGISYAMTDKSVMYANYGHFFQPLNFADIYQNLDADITNGLPIIGNPNLPPQKEIMYEGGFRYAFTPDMAGEISAYFKDVKTLLSTREKRTIFKGKLAPYTIYQLQDFATVKGIDVIFTKRARRFLSGTISYSYQDAKGTGSSSREYYYRYMNTGISLPKKEYPLEFDITHTIKTGLNFNIPEKWGPFALKIQPLSNLNANLQFVFMSGAPYTPTDSKGRPQEVGSKRMPAISNIDLRIDKGFKFRGLDIGFFADVRNLLNTKNVVDIYSRTGKPDDNGDPPKWIKENYESQYEDYNARHGKNYKSGWDMYLDDLANWERYYNDPTNYSNPRIIRFGIEIKF
ncbi:TonB-dependent receptor [candidate division WOR-3 bacterium]|nr:TonB-dependent receptor [candidate division WOR-3 bacterium]